MIAGKYEQIWSIYLRMESAFELAKEAALHWKHERKENCEADAAHCDIGPKHHIKLLIFNDQHHYYCRYEADDVDQEEGHKVVSLTLKVGEEQDCRYHESREGYDGNYKWSPGNCGSEEDVDQYEHQDWVGDKLNELAGSIVLDKVDGNEHIPYDVETE